MKGYRAEQIIKWLEIKFHERKPKRDRWCNKRLLVNWWEKLRKDGVKI